MGHRADAVLGAGCPPLLAAGVGVSVTLEARDGIRSSRGPGLSNDFNISASAVERPVAPAQPASTRGPAQGVVAEQRGLSCVTEALLARCD
eukprot:2773029-Ditylum_brightwellii.AAC.1